MLDLKFRPEIQALIDAGVYEVVRNAAGHLIGVARDKVTGRFVGNAVATLVGNTRLAPIVALAQFAVMGGQIIQNHMGFQGVNRRVESGFEKTNQKLENINTDLHNFQKEANVRFDVMQSGLQSLQANVGVLQGSAALIGVGAFAGAALAAVNLHQVLQMREDVKQLKLEVKDGFIDLKQALASQGTEIIQRIDAVAQDMKFEQHRLELIKAYGRFLEATKLMKTAMSLQDMSARKIELANARQTLGEALASYNNPHLLSETCAAGQLRRMECAWAIEQTIVMTYQLQDEPAAVSDRLSQLQTKIRQDILSIADRCGSQAELDFLYPEIKRINDHDLVALESWQNHVDWVRSLPQAELLQLQSVDSPATAIASDLDAVPITLAKPPEQILYEEIKPKSHFDSLRDQLKLMISNDLRQKYEAYVGEQALASGHKALEPTNLKTVSELTVANLYWYFKARDMEKAS